MPSEPHERSVASYRPVIPGDLDLIRRHRHEMFKSQAAPMRPCDHRPTRLRGWLKPRLVDGSYFG